MERVPCFSSLFFRQRLNASVLPMLGGILLFLLLPAVWAVLLILFFSVISLILIFRKEGEDRKIFLCVLAGLSLALLLMGVRGIQRVQMEKLCGAEREVEGYVVVKEDGFCDLALYRLDGAPFYKRVRVKEDVNWNLGERLRVNLVLYAPDPEGDRGESVDVLASCEKSASRIGKSFLYTLVGQIRQSLLDRFATLQNGGFLAAVLLGDRSGLTEAQKNAFRSTASSHLLAISGLHISQTVAFMAAVFRLFPVSRKISRILLFPFVFVLYLLAGAGVSVFRAAVMTLFAAMGLLLRRRSDSVTALCFSAAVLVMANPYAPESFSFLLSYTATFGVVYCGAPLCEYIRYRFTEKEMPFVLRKLQAVVLLLVMSTVSFVFITPVQMLLFGTASPFGPLYAVILIPLFQICLILSLVGALLSGLAFLPDTVSAFCLGIPARFPDLVIFLAKGAPAPVESETMSVVIAAVFLTVMIVMFRKKSPMTAVLVLFCVWIVFLGALSLMGAIIG